MRTLSLLALLFIVVACQQKPLELPLETVSDAIYNAKTCPEILADRDRLEYLYEEEKKYKPSDEYSVLSIPRDFGLSIAKVFNKDIGENRKRKIRRYEKIKGEYQSVERVAVRRCGYISPNGEAEAEISEVEISEVEDSEEYTSETEVIEEENSEEAISEVEISEVEDSEEYTSETEVIEEETSEVDTSEVDTSEVENSEVDTSEVEVSEEATSEVENSEVETSEEEASE